MKSGWHIWTHPRLVGLGYMDHDPRQQFTVVSVFSNGATDQEDAATAGEAVAQLLYNAADVGPGTTPPRGKPYVVEQYLAGFYDGPYEPRLLVAMATTEKRLMKAFRHGVDVVVPGRGLIPHTIYPLVEAQYRD